MKPLCTIKCVNKKKEELLKIKIKRKRAWGMTQWCSIQGSLGSILNSAKRENKKKGKERKKENLGG
jgi:hypothetical protein